MIGMVVFLSKLFVFQSLRYFLIGGSAFAVLNIWAREYFQKYQIQDRQSKYQAPSRKQIISEIKNSLVTLFIFSAFFSIVLTTPIGSWVKLYSDFKHYPLWWNILSLPFLVVVHDTYFYWMHRTLHHKFFYGMFHSTHHHSMTPTPFASFSFHPVEAFFEVVWIFPVLVYVPLHKYILISFAFVSFLNNVKGHLGFEFSKTENVLLNSSTHHSHHHRYFNCNYGLYFLFWDRMCKTEKL
jgi:sterol desaturase/sphingolipid hydroxylase (fatty acid hydroxylase superfamily)